MVRFNPGAGPRKGSDEEVMAGSKVKLKTLAQRKLDNLIEYRKVFEKYGTVERLNMEIAALELVVRSEESNEGTQQSLAFEGKKREAEKLFSEVKKILSDSGQPLAIETIAERLKLAGLKTTKTALYNSLYRRHLRKGEVEKVGMSTFGLRNGVAKTA